MSKMLKSSGAMGAATLTSRILGMVREIVYARFMGDGWVASAFVMALTIPNLFRRLLGEGALTAAFIPIFKQKEKIAGETEMWRSANAVISGLFVAAGIIIALVVAGVTLALLVFHLEEQTDLMLRLLRLMFPYMLLACLAAIFMGILNARGVFFVPALGAVWLNLVMIASVLWLAPLFGKELPTAIFGLALGVLVAGIVQALFQIPALRKEGFRYRWVTPWGDETVSAVVRKMIPGALGVAAFQLNVLLIQVFAFWVDDTIVASFNYAVRLMELPQGVFGISLATFLLPALSGMAAEKKFDEFCATLKQSLVYLVFVNLLASVLLIVLAEPIIRLLFERGRFGPDATDRAAFALACLAPGLVAFSAIHILARAFYALGDTKAPMQISIVCLGLNLVFSFWLIGAFRQGGLGMANTITSLVNVFLLSYALRRKIRRLSFGDTRRRVLLISGAAVVAAMVAWITHRWWEGSLGHSNLLLQLGAVFVPMILASGAYGAVSLAAGIPEAKDILDLVRQQLRRLRPSR